MVVQGLNRWALLTGVSFLALGAGLADSTPAEACATASGGSTLSVQIGCIDWNDSPLSITNTGTIAGTGATYALKTSTSGFGTLTNNGLISGPIVNNFAVNLTINSDTTGTLGSTIGTIGSIANTANNVVFNSGNQRLTGNINATGHTVVNSGENLVLGGTITVTGAYTQNTLTGTLSVNAGSSELVVTGAAAISDGTVLASYSSLANHLRGETFTLVQGGGGSSYSANNSNNAALVQSALNGLVVAGSVSGNNLLAVAQNNYIGTTTASLSNTGNISTASAYYVAASGHLGTLTNTGTIDGAGEFGITVASGGQVDTINNSGTISGLNGIHNSGSIAVVSNQAGGTISGNYAILDSGTIGTISNSGVIMGTLGAISISAGGIGTIGNSGLIAGNIINSGTQALTINGGSNGAIGTLTGFATGTAGTITSTLSNLTFATGSLLLNDDINVGSFNVLNSGATLRLNNARTITGNYSQTGGGLVIGVASSSSYGRLSVSNNATIAGTSITISGSSLTTGQTYSIVHAGGAGSYSNDTVTISGTNGLSASVSVSGNDLLVTLNSAQTITTSTITTPSITTPTTTPTAATAYASKGVTADGAAVGVGVALDAIAKATTPAAITFQNNVLTALNSLPAAQQPAAIKQLAAPQTTPSALVANLTAAPAISAIEQHESAPNEGGGTGASSGSAGHDYGLWGKILGGEALRDTTPKADGYRSSDFGLVSGLDVVLDPDTTVGGAFGWVRGWAAGLAGSTGSFTTVDSYQVNSYGQHHWGPAFADGQVGFGYNSFNQRREIGFLNQAAHASYGGEQYLAKVRVGYDIPTNDGLTYTPLAKVRYLRSVNDAYSESGSAENLTVNRRGVQSITQDIGGQVSWNANSAWGAVTPEVRLAWVHDYKQAPIASSGILGGTVAFTSSVAQPSADGARVNAIATLETAGDLTVKVEYEGEMRHDYQSHTGVLKATWGF
jgi:uncharacterized protein with beta-barrel porin domain